MPEQTELERLLRACIEDVKEARRMLEPLLPPKPPGASLRLVKPSKVDARSEGRRVA